MALFEQWCGVTSLDDDPLTDDWDTPIGLERRIGLWPTQASDNTAVRIADVLTPKTSARVVVRLAREHSLQWAITFDRRRARDHVIIETLGASQNVEKFAKAVRRKWRCSVAQDYKRGRLAPSGRFLQIPEV